MSENEIPYGYCHCGCGQKTKLAAKNRAEAGWTKGKPLRFLNGHHSLPNVPASPPNPSGLCMCGCGEYTPIAARNNVVKGYVAGQPVRFVVGHQARVRAIRSPEERFWEKVDKRGPDDCWQWVAGSNQHGYGTFFDGERCTKAHRFSYALQNGSIPDGMDICHKCDNPPCCNPNHLFAGTAQDNITDAIAKGRHVPPPPNQVEGETNGLAQYTHVQVREFRRLYTEGQISISAFANLHGVPVTSMWRIIKRITYKNA